MNKEYAYILGKVKDAAHTALEYTPLNTDARTWEHHTVRLMDDFLTTIEVYLAENKPREPTDK